MSNDVFETILPILMIVAGVVNLRISRKFTRDPKFARAYVEKSFKAFIWRKTLGVERTIALTRSVFAPAGLVLSVVLIVAGAGWLGLGVLEMIAAP